MELFNFPLMCMYKTLELKIFVKKILRSFDTGIVKK